jgi:hypothetical protein
MIHDILLQSTYTDENVMKQNHFCNDKLLPLSAELEDFVHLQPFPASFKEAKRGQYRFCNEALASRDGIAMGDYIGLTSHDVGKIMHHKNAVIENAVEMDQRIFTARFPRVHYRQVLPVHDGSLAIEEVTKQPVFNQQNTIAGLLAYAQNITNYVNPLFLFSLYKEYYPIEGAIQHFLRYIKLDSIFYERPTHSELLTLLIMRDIEDKEFIAARLNCSTREVMQYQAQLRDKLKYIGLDEALIQLQKPYEYETWDH